MASGTPWRDGRPPENAWRGDAGRTPTKLAAEQDKAAGGRDSRSIRIADDRTARASVELKLLPKQRRIRAYLRWYSEGKSHATYVGEVDESTRAQNLRAAWKIARERGLLDRSEESWATSPAARNVMRANKGKNTKPELAVRSALHALGLRYRVGIRPEPSLRRTADVTFPQDRVAVFVDGCFWHGCAEHYRPSTGANAEFWSDKVAANRARDRETTDRLEAVGWTVVRAWEHEDPTEVAQRIRSIVRTAREAA